MLERDAETDALALLVARAASGEGGALLLCGPAGIGKTALLDLVRERSELPVLSARGSELGRDVAFGAVHALFGDAPARTDLHGAARHAAGVFASAGAPDHAIVHGLYWLTVELGPLTLVVDDAHWLDPGSLRWLAYLAGRVAELPVALVLAARDDAPDEGLRRLARHAATRTLAPLSPAAVRALAGERAEAVHAATGGNPFHVRALLDSPGAAPRDVHEAIAARLGALGPACVRLARALAVLDGAGSGTLAARLARLDVRTTVEAAEALRSADLVGGDDRLHPLVREAVYGAIPDGERAAAHTAAAHRLAEAGAPTERVAAQLLHGEPGGGAWDVAALRRAAAAAWARGAPAPAARLLLRAREEDMAREERIALLRELASALSATEAPGGLPYRYEALGLAATADERAGLTLDLARALAAGGFSGEAATLLERALAEREDPGLREGLATVAVLDLRVLRRLGGLGALAGGATPAGTFIEVATRPGAAPPETLQATEPGALAAGGLALMAAGRLEEAERQWTGVAEAARAAGALGTLRFAVVLRSMVRVRLGDVAAAEADLRELIAWTAELEPALADHAIALPWAVAPLVEAGLERGALDEAQSVVAQSGLESGWPEVLGFTFLLDALGRLRLAQGRVPEAIGLLRECGRRQRAWGLRNPGLLPWRTSLAAALAASGRTSEALDLCDEQADLARAFGVRREEGMALRLLGVLTGDAGPLERAADVLRGCPARLELARALTDLGAARGDPEPLQEALDLAVGCGATALAGRAHDALAGMGLPPGRPVLTGAGALSPAEARVARLAADGLGDREIAERGFVTERTVEVRLGAAYRKLGIASRAQLAEALMGSGPRSAMS